MGLIKPGARVYLDTNVLIYLTEGATDLNAAALDALMQQFESAGAVFITSDLTLGELLVHPIRSGNEALIAVYETLFGTFVTPQPISREVLYLSAQLRAQTPGQRMPDAIHVASATLARADVFVTGDKGIRNIPAWMVLRTI